MKSVERNKKGINPNKQRSIWKEDSGKEISIALQKTYRYIPVVIILAKGTSHNLNSHQEDW